MFSNPEMRTQKRETTISGKIAVHAPPSRRWVSILAGLLTFALAGVAPLTSAEPFPAEFQLSGLLPENGGDGSDGFVAKRGFTQRASDFLGWSVSNAGDVNADGIDDVVMSIPYNSSFNFGKSYVLFGTDAGVTAEFNLEALESGDGSLGFVIVGIADQDRSGSGVSAAGDVNGDGIDDLVIGARGADPGGREDAGQAYVVFGRDTALDGDFPGNFQLSSLLPANGGDGSEGFVLNGIVAGDEFGLSVSGAIDINGDLLDDVIIGTWYAGPNGAGSGQTSVVFGSDLGFPAVLEMSALDGTVGFHINGANPGDSSGGWVISKAGDVNDDGFGDVLIGAANANFGTGAGYVIFGTDGAFPAALDLSAVNGSNGFALNGIRVNDNAGNYVGDAGDINNDGIDDIVIGAPAASPPGNIRRGQAYVVFGHDGAYPAALDLATLNGANGFLLNGISSFHEAGWAVGTAGDLNADGIDDLLVGTFELDSDPIDPNELYVIYGKTTGFSATLELSTLDSANGFVIKGVEVGDAVGFSATTAGDFNADGIDDIIIGASRADDLAIDTGEAYVVFGRADTDGDGVHDGVDNCIAAENSDQRDSDGDGLGNRCDTDIAIPNDCITNAVDLGIFKLAFFATPALANWNPDADFNGDDSVNSIDLGILKSFFFQAPGPSAQPNACMP
jgi:glycosylphosphatidylinositol phospholipase D